jgi:hypothetical protein
MQHIRPLIALTIALTKNTYPDALTDRNYNHTRTVNTQIHKLHTITLNARRSCNGVTMVDNQETLELELKFGHLAEL